MADTELLDRGFAALMSRLVETGRVHHFTELADELDVDLPAARALVHELVEETPGWMHPGTDYIASFPPFNVQPTHYAVSIDGREGWFAQCGLEALAIRWVVPGRQVRIEAPCLCCGDPVVVEMSDAGIDMIEPSTAVGYTSEEIGGPSESRPLR